MTGKRQTPADVFATELQALERQGLRRHLITLQGTGPADVLDGQRILNFASNDYLGLAPLPAMEGPSGSAASRLVTGTLQEHQEVEASLAALVSMPSALLFSSGYAANVGAISALMGQGDVIFSDSLNHASLIDGARLSRASVRIFPHNDIKALEAALDTHRSTHRRALIISEAIFSMDGDAAPVRSLRNLADAHDAWLYIDEAHSVGVLGPHGAGLCAKENVRADFLLGTLGKAFGTQGAFLAADATTREWLIHRARSFVFSTAPGPHHVRTILRNGQRVREADDARTHALAMANSLRQRLRALKLEVRGGAGLISSIVLGEPERATAFAERLLAQGILARAIRPPTVPPGTSRVRIVVTAAHTAEHIDQLVHACAQAKGEAE